MVPYAANEPLPDAGKRPFLLFFVEHDREHAFCRLFDYSPFYGAEGMDDMDSFRDLFEQVLLLCKADETIADVTYNLFFQDLEPVDFTDDTAVLQTGSDFKQGILTNKYAQLLQKNFEKLLGFPVRLEIRVKDKAAEETAPVFTPESTAEKYTFDTFVVGAENKFAYAACQRVARDPGAIYNPLFIYGRSGLGKTHLLMATQNEILKNNPNANILYTTSENFTNDMVSFLAQKNMEEFHNKYRTVDVLLIDDVQFLQNKMGIQEEFFHTFNALTQVGKQVILTSDRPPREIDTLTDRLRNRFESGLLADIQPPAIETRMAIVKKKAQQYDMNLSPQIVEYIAEKLKNNIRQLEGAVKKIFAMTSLTGREPTIDMAEDAIRDVQTDNMPIGVKTEKIIEYVAQFYGITPADITSNKKNANIALARQVTVYVLREITGQTLQVIGEAIGGKNHSTVNYSISLVEKKMRSEPSFKNTVFEIIHNLQE